MDTTALEVAEELIKKQDEVIKGLKEEIEIYKKLCIVKDQMIVNLKTEVEVCPE